MAGGWLISQNGALSLSCHCPSLVQHSQSQKKVLDSMLLTLCLDQHHQSLVKLLIAWTSVAGEINSAWVVHQDGIVALSTLEQEETTQVMVASQEQWQLQMCSPRMDSGSCWPHIEERGTPENHMLGDIGGELEDLEALEKKKWNSSRRCMIHPTTLSSRAESLGKQDPLPQTFSLVLHAAGARNRMAARAPLMSVKWCCKNAAQAQKKKEEIDLDFCHGEMVLARSPTDNGASCASALFQMRNEPAGGSGWTSGGLPEHCNDPWQGGQCHHQCQQHFLCQHHHCQ